jgi:hypothetical protein
MWAGPEEGAHQSTWQTATRVGEVNRDRMPFVDVRSGSECWHNLRPHEQQLAWCQGSLNDRSWTQSALQVPRESVCSACLRDVGASKATAEGDPSLGGTF